jgi:hypothetical protein
MVFNATFSNISVISWWSVLLVEEPGVPGEIYRPAASNWQALSHNVVHFCFSSYLLTNVLSDLYTKRQPLQISKENTVQIEEVNLLSFVSCVTISSN